MTGIRLYEGAKDGSQIGGEVFRQFGGVKIFAATNRELVVGIERVSRAIIEVCAGSSGLAPSLIRYLVEREIGVKLPKRVVGALLGSQLRQGALDVAICEGPQGSSYRVILHRDRIEEFGKRVQKICGDLVMARTLRIAEIRDEFFPENARGSWTQAMYIAGRVARLGFAVFPDRYSINMPVCVANAILQSDHTLDLADTGRVAQG